MQYYVLRPLSSLLGDVFLPQAPKISIFEGLDKKPLFPIENKKKEQKNLPKNTTNKQKKKQKKKKDAQAKSESIQEKESNNGTFKRFILCKFLKMAISGILITNMTKRIGFTRPMMSTMMLLSVSKIIKKSK
jgi:hypothetical protein